MIVIVDHGLGELESISELLSQKQHPHKISADPNDICSADGLILHGVPPFKEVMYHLVEPSLHSLLRREAIGGKPLLGIHIGMHLLFTSSDQDGYHNGLNLLAGHVKPVIREASSWSYLLFEYPHPLTNGLEEDIIYTDFHFQIALDNSMDILATAQTGDIAIVCRNNIVGMNFLPEQSGELGAELLDRFAKLV